MPFLDRAMLELCMNIDPAEKMIVKGERIEKWIVRAAFDTPEEPYIPSEVLWRQKEQFSDGVGYSWIDGLKDHAEKEVSDDLFSRASFKFPVDTPKTKEDYLYRVIFEKHFPHKSAAMTVPTGPSVACSTAAAVKWDKEWANCVDPSGRAVSGVHDSDYAKEAKQPSSKKQKK